MFSTGRVWDAAKNIGALDLAAPLVRWPDIRCGRGAASRRRTAILTAQCISVGQVIRPRASGRGSRGPAFMPFPPCTSPSDYPFSKRHCPGARWFSAIFPSLREIWGDAALFVPPSDHEALALSINLLASNRGMREDFGTRARERARNFTSDRMVHSYLGVYPHGARAIPGSEGGSGHHACRDVLSLASL